MPCEGTKGKKKKPPKEWFERMSAEVKAGNPDYSDEQVSATVGAIWYKNLSPKQKTQAKSMMDEDMSGIAMLKEMTDDLEKGMVGAERPGHKYYKRVPKSGGGYTYYYTKEDWQSKRGRSEPPPAAKTGATFKLPQYDERGEVMKETEVLRIVPAREIDKDFRADYYRLYLADGKQADLPEKYLDEHHPGWRGLLGRSGKPGKASHSRKESSEEARASIEPRRYWKEDLPFGEESRKELCRRANVSLSWGNSRWEDIPEDVRASIEGVKQERSSKAIGKSRNEEGTDMKARLGSLIDMDPLRAANEGKTGLDMLKGLTSEFEKAKDGKCSHLNSDGTFKGGFGGCVSHFQSCKGLPEENAKRMCAYIGRKTGKIPAGGGGGKSEKSLTQLEIGEVVLPVAGLTYETDEAMVKAMDAVLQKAREEDEEEDETEEKGWDNEEEEPKKSKKKKASEDDEEEESEEEGEKESEEEEEEEPKKSRKKKPEKREESEEEEEEENGLEMLRSVSAGLEKPLRKSSVETGPKGLSFSATGERIQGGIAAKVAELNQKLAKLLARHPNCEVDDELADYPAPVGESIASCANKEEHWEIRDLKRKIDRLGRIARNIDPKKTFSLSDWDLQEYGL